MNDEIIKNLVQLYANANVRIEQLERENAVLREDKERLDWIASRQSTQLVYFTAAGWAIIKASGGDLLHERNIHDLRTAIDAARAKEAKP